MSIDALGFIGFNSERLDEWADFGTRFLGLEIVEQTSDVLKFRMDDRKQRIMIRKGACDTGWTGWEVSGHAAMEAFASRLESAGIRCDPIPATELAMRAVKAGFHFHDPAGNRLEVFHDAELATTEFKASRSISGFRTGALGVGHIVYQMPDVKPLQRFYEDVMAFRLSDYFEKPVPASFYHVNPRHHSLAFAQSPKRGIHHFMIELNQLDDVGQGYDVARVVPNLVATSLGRHINDLMTSFYVRTPDNFFIEYGWGGRQIDMESWQPFELAYGPSLWGHDRDWLSPEGFEEAARLRKKAAEDGLRHPVQVADGNYETGYALQRWWEQPDAAGLP